MAQRFTPQGTLLLVYVPDEYFEKKSNIIVDSATKEQMLTEYIAAGKDLIVGPCGSDVKFVREGDTVAVETRGSSKIKVDGDKREYMCIRESQILGKLS